MSHTHVVPEAIQNPYNFYVQVVVGLLKQNIGTTENHANELNILTDSSEELSKAWTQGGTGSGSNATTIADELKLVYAKAKKGVIPITMSTFITTYMTPGNIDSFSSQLGIAVMNKLAQVWSEGNTAARPNQMNFINQWCSLISSNAQNEEATGQNLTKTESSVVQQDAGSQQGFADMGTTVSGVVSNFASLFQLLA